MESFADIHELERVWPEALVNVDIDLLEEILAEDFSLTTPDGTNIAREDCLAGLVGDEIRFDMFEPTPRRFSVYGDDVVVRGPARVECPRGLPALNAAEHYVAIYSRRGASWLQAAVIVTSASRRRSGTRT